MLTSDPVAAPAEARAAAKEFLRIEGTADDAVIGRLVASAMVQCEAFLGAILIERGFIETLDVGAGWQALIAAPVTALTAATARDGTALPVGTYATDIDAQGNGLVRLTGGPKRVLRVTYRAGLAASWADLPVALREGVVRVAGLAHAWRDGPASAMIAAVAPELRPFRRMRLA